ncbi:cytochrome C biogenesis protein [Candidatus Peregrinibacteria bacterium CG11_big_fil_rev_8_21_14_0_20_46_8]|nr:MAG: cytochrome C biogenesis protein [Candidatus Peregrinibacteria bacterium CG11_big_fil_rev_8_21_14_0_20_46_8]
MDNLNIGIAFIAGIVSFLSPCVLPIIPGFLTYLAGTSVGESTGKRMRIFLNSLFFVLGFSVIFALLGVLLNTVLESVAYEAQAWLARIGGLIIIFFGLYLTGLIKIKFLEQEHKVEVKKRFGSQYLTSFFFGAAFAAGWTPCVGAVLGAILGLAATSPGSAFSLLLSYSIGLGVPFLIVGLFTAQASAWIKASVSWLKYVRMIFGVILIVLGILAFTQKLSLVANFDFVNNLLLDTSGTEESL